MRRDGKFRPERFTDPDLIRERTLSECKQKLYQLQWSRREPGETKEDQAERIQKAKEELAEFIRDVIAIANAARQRGEPGYLLFGINDTTKRIISSGIEGQSTNPKLVATLENQERIQELIERDFDARLTEFVYPTKPVFDYWPGYVEGKLVSYLEIVPAPTPEPYQVKENLDGIQNPLRIGDCWVRQGESKGDLLNEQEKRYLYAWTEVPYVEVQQWINYLRELTGGPTLDEIPAYQTLHSTTGLTLEEEFLSWLYSPSSASLLIIDGDAGCGKSIFLQDQVHKTAQTLLAELNDLHASEEHSQSISFVNPIPILFNLNSFSIKLGELFERELLVRIIGQGLLNLPNSNEPEKLIKDEGKKWIVFLDAFDEINPAPQNDANVWTAIRRFAESYSNVKIVLSGRSGGIPRSIPKYAHVITIAPLTKEQILKYLQARLESFDTEITDFLNSNEELWEHLQLPLFLQVAATYLSGGAIHEQDQGKTNLLLDDNSNENLSPVENEIDNLGTTGEIDIREITAMVHDELVDEAQIPLDIIRPDEAEIRDEEISLSMGIFLDRVFHQLWKHNEKKCFVGLQLGRLEDAYEALGKMAARMAGRERIRRVKAKRYVGDGLYWILDLGILRGYKTWISFPTVLSKSYFAAVFVSVLLEDDPDDLLDFVKDSADFWNHCLELVVDLTLEDVSPLVKQIEILQGA